MVKDIKSLLTPEEPFQEVKEMYLWNGKSGVVDYGKQYHGDDDE